MKKKAILLSVILLLTLTAFQVGTQSNTNISDFEIIITVSSEGVQLKNVHGCAWIETSYSEGSVKKYSFKVDELGVYKVE